MLQAAICFLDMPDMLNFNLRKKMCQMSSLVYLRLPLCFACLHGILWFWKCIQECVAIARTLLGIAKRLQQLKTQSFLIYQQQWGISHYPNIHLISIFSPKKGCKILEKCSDNRRKCTHPCMCIYTSYHCSAQVPKMQLTGLDHP